MIGINFGVYESINDENIYISCDILRREDWTENESNIAKILEKHFMEIMKDLKTIKMRQSREIHEQSTKSWATCKTKNQAVENAN